MLIGPSIGWIYNKGVYSPLEIRKVLEDSGATAVEFPLSPFNDADKRIASLENLGFSDMYSSLHFPKYKGFNISQYLSLIDFVNKYDFDISLVHSRGIPSEIFDEIAKRKIPFAIENIDGNSKQEDYLGELERLLAKYPAFKWVFDVRHAYDFEESGDIGYSKELFDLFRDRLAHLHVSGDGKDGNAKHAFVYKSKNRKQILKIMEHVLSRKDVPVIMEGAYRNTAEIVTEIDFLKREIGF